MAMKRDTCPIALFLPYLPIYLQRGDTHNTQSHYLEYQCKEIRCHNTHVHLLAPFFEYDKTDWLKR